MLLHWLIKVTEARDLAKEHWYLDRHGLQLST